MNKGMSLRFADSCLSVLASAGGWWHTHPLAAEWFIELGWAVTAPNRTGTPTWRDNRWVRLTDIGRSVLAGADAGARLPENTVDVISAIDAEIARRRCPVLPPRPRGWWDTDAGMAWRDVERLAGDIPSYPALVALRDRLTGGVS